MRERLKVLTDSLAGRLSDYLSQVAKAERIAAQLAAVEDERDAALAALVDDVGVDLAARVTGLSPARCREATRRRPVVADTAAAGK